MECSEACISATWVAAGSRNHRRSQGSFKMKPPVRERSHATMADESEWASEASEQALVPAEQATIRFYDREIIAVRLPDGRIAAALRSMCDALQLERYSQVRRIRDDD